MQAVRSEKWTAVEAAAVGVVEDFLACMGAGRLRDAERHLASDVSMVFPGGRRYGSLSELAEASRSRYRRVDKVRQHYDAVSAPNGEVVVISIGTLHGENLYGVEYANVRYVDRFVVRDSLIRSQQVWNDLADSGVLTARSATQIAEQWRVSADVTSDGNAPGATGAVYVRRSATAAWTGHLRGGQGSLALQSGAAAAVAMAERTCPISRLVEGNATVIVTTADGAS